MSMFSGEIYGVAVSISFTVYGPKVYGFLKFVNGFKFFEFHL